MKTLNDNLKLRPKKYAGHTISGHARLSSAPFPVAVDVAEALGLPLGDAIRVHIDIPGEDGGTGYALLYAFGEYADWLEEHAARAAESGCMYEICAKSIWGVSYDQIFSDQDPYTVPDTHTGFLLLDIPVPVTEHAR